MPRLKLPAVLGVFIFMMLAQGPANVLFAGNSPESQYEVLSPWAEVDSIPLRGISPRIDNLVGKKIGLFVNYKRAARPIGLALEKRLKSMFSQSDVSFFYSLQWNVLESENDNKEKFKTWAKNNDAVILLVGD
jgi:hypothetical protein